MTSANPDKAALFLLAPDFEDGKFPGSASFAGTRRIALDQGRELAIGISNARFVVLESRSHIILGHEPAWTKFMDELQRFLAETV